MLIKIQQKGCERDSLPGTLQRTVSRLRAWKGKRSGQHSGAGFSKLKFIRYADPAEIQIDLRMREARWPRVKRQNR